VVALVRQTALKMCNWVIIASIVTVDRFEEFMYCIDWYHIRIVDNMCKAKV